MTKIRSTKRPLPCCISFCTEGGRGGEERAWKGFDWETMNRLYEKGYIHDPRSKAKSVLMTTEGAKRAAELFAEKFARTSAAPLTQA